MTALLLEYSILFFTAFVSAFSVFLFKVKFTQNLKLLLSFSGAFLLAICILHLIPEIYEDYSTQIGMFILIGFLLQVLLEFFSTGIEHGHFHTHHKDITVFPYAVFLSLCIHSFVEGMALINSEHHHLHEHNHPLLIGIVIHKIPVAIVLATLLLNKHLSKLTFFTAVFIFSVSAPLGLLLASSGILSFVENTTIFLALAVGIFLHISTTILFESGDGHKFDLKKFTTIILAFVIAYLTL